MGFGVWVMPFDRVYPAECRAQGDMSFEFGGGLRG